MASKADVMVALVTSFGVFSAFGAAILAFFTVGGGLQRISNWFISHQEERAGSDRAEADEQAVQRGKALVWLVTAVVTLTVIVNGIGLFASFFWLVASGNGDAQAPSWAYACAEDMFYIVAVGISVITAIAVVGSALAALPSSRTAGHLQRAVR